MQTYTCLFVNSSVNPASDNGVSIILTSKRRRLNPMAAENCKD